MLNTFAIPLEVQILNKNKPIPFGLWDTYREKYTWRPTFIIPDEGKSSQNVRMLMINGENETLIYELYINNEYANRAIPKRINIGWWDKNGQGYNAFIYFDENEIRTAFKSIFKDQKDGKIDIEMKVNKLNSFVSITLKGNGKEIAINEKTVIDAFKSEGLTEKYNK